MPNFSSASRALTFNKLVTEYFNLAFSASLSDTAKISSNDDFALVKGAVEGNSLFIINFDKLDQFCVNIHT